MKKLNKICFIFLCILLIFSPVQGKEKKIFSTTPRTNNGEKWKIGYYQGGDYANYYGYMVSAVRGLMDLGWIEESPIPDIKTQETLPLWTWLSKEVKSQYIQFEGIAYYDAKWNKKIRQLISAQLIKRLSSKKDIDLMIAMGTWAGKDLSNNKHQVNTLVMSTSDPVRAGIIKSEEDSGFDHIHARVDPLRYERQLMVFHDMVGFKTLGVAYENSLDGRSYAALNSIRKIAKERGVEVVECFTQSDVSDQHISNKSVISCFEKLASQVDAIYVTVQGGVNATTLPEIVAITHEKKIPTFSQLGSKEVEQGLLLSIARKGGFKSAGRYFAALFAQIFNGAKPRELDQVFEEKMDFAVNLKTAESIGFYLHADIIAAADEIYRDIKKP